MMQSIKFIFLVLLTISNTTYSQERKIKAGDVLNVVVYGEGVAGLSRVISVEQDGTVDFPFLQDTPVEGFSLTELQSVISARLLRNLRKQAVVSVSFASEYTVSVTVLGAILIPGTVNVGPGSSVQGAITQAGGYDPRAQLDQIKLVRNRNGSQEEIIINLEKFITEGTAELLPPPLEEGDVIIVPGRIGSSAVKILGAIENPGSYEVLQGTNIYDIIFLAGGFTGNAATSRIVLISPHKKRYRQIQIDLVGLLQDGNPENIPIVEAGDIIYVPAKFFTWSKFVTFMRDITVFIVLYLLLTQGRFFRI